MAARIPKVGGRGTPAAEGSPYPMTRKPMVGGAMILIGGILGLVDSVFVVLGAGELGQGFQSAVLTPEQIAATGLAFLVLNLVAIAGGIAALRRRFWGLALAGGIIGIFVGGFILGNLLALVGTIMVGLARREFVGHREYVAERRLTGA